MDASQRFIQTENIRIFSEKLYTERSPQQQDVLTRLLVEEENKFGVLVWHFELAQRHILDGNRRVQRQQKLITQMKTDGRDTVDAEKLLQNMMDTLSLFHEFHARVAQQLQNSAI